MGRSCEKSSKNRNSITIGLRFFPAAKLDGVLIHIEEFIYQTSSSDGYLDSVVCGGVLLWMLKYISYVMKATSNLCKSVKSVSKK